MAIWGETSYVPGLMGASGITKEQAKACLYYAIATFLLPDRINLMPLLVIMGPQGTGKWDLLEQMGKMVNEPKEISVQTKAALRDKLPNSCRINSINTEFAQKPLKFIEDILVEGYCSWRFVFYLTG